MTYDKTNGVRRSSRHRGALLVAVFVSLIAGTAGVVGAPDPAAAAPFAVSTADGSFFSGPVTISGVKEEGSRVQVGVTGATPYCISPGVDTPPTGETWSCTFTPASGSYAITSTQFFDDGSVVPVSQTITVRVLGAPSLMSPTLTTGLISGAGYPGAGILVAANGASGSYNQQCTTVQSGGFWSCPLPLPSGTYDVSLQQVWPGTGEAGATTGTQSITIDKEPPAAPTITSPSAGATVTAQPISYSGTGEDGARVDLFIDSALQCTASVAGGTWSCAAGGIAPGQRAVQAIQWDAAGNPSAASTTITVTFAEPSTAQPGAPAPPAPPGSPAPTPAPSSSATAPPSASPLFPDIPFPLFPPPVGGQSGLPPFDTWGTPTHYGAAIPAASAVNWLTALLLALAYIALVAIPARMLVTILRGRIAFRPRRIAGRNRIEPEDQEPLLGPWVTAAGALAAAVLLATLAGGVQAEVRYLRLVIAIGLALLAINGLAIALAAKSTAKQLGGAAGMRLVPLLLGAAAVSALVSRGLGIQPPIIVGVVIAATLVVGATTRGRGMVAVAQLVSLIVLGVWAWIGHGAIGPVDGFWPSLASETLAAICIAGLGSALFLLLPIGGMPGRYVFDWSPPAWFALAGAGGIAASGAIAEGDGFPARFLVVVAAAFAAVSLAAWAWVRFVEPQLVEQH